MPITEVKLTSEMVVQCSRCGEELDHVTDEHSAYERAALYAGHECLKEVCHSMVR